MDEENKDSAVYQPTPKETETATSVIKKYIKARNVVQRSYNQFNGRTLYQAIDDWMKRWNGYIPEPSPLLDSDQSQIFLNFTRNQVISYLSNVALTRPKTKIGATNKKIGSNDLKFAEVLQDLLDYSAEEENGDAKFLAAAMEAVTKGTVIAYEGYARNVQELNTPEDFDAQTGKIKIRKENRTIFDNCYQRLVPIEDFFIANPYQTDVQKQPFVIWREITTFEESKVEFGDYKNFEYVKPGAFTLANDVTTFYRNQLLTELSDDQVEILRFYEKTKNKHVIMVNNVIIYDGPIPFKDGNYPFAKGIFEPYANDFFWGLAFAQKIMGEQDLLNTMWNMMVDKTMGSLLPYGLSSDLDDWIEDDTLALNRIRKVGDISKWKFDTLPGVSSGEQAMLQTTLNLARENSGVTGGGASTTPRGGKLNVRQVLLQQQEAMKKMSFPMTFMEDFEKDRVRLRLNHILQFYSIPKIEKITGKNGKEIEQMSFRDVRLSNRALSGGLKGNKYIKLVEAPENPDDRQKLQDELSMEEAKGDITNTPTEALALVVDTFYDYNLSVEIIKASSYEKNAALDQASRMEYANWRLGVSQAAPVDASKLVDWVSESFDIDQDEFKPQQNPMIQQGQPDQPEQPQQPGQNPLKQIQPSSLPNLSNTLGA